MNIPNNPWLKQSKLRQLFENAPAGSLNLAIGQPGEDTPAFIRETAQTLLKTVNLGYTKNAGIVELREKLAADFGSDKHPDSICVTNGVQQGLFTLFSILADKNSSILLPDPGFLTYPSLAGLSGWNTHYYALLDENNFRFDADTVLQALTPDTKALLVAHPSNPTGSNASALEYEKLVNFLKEGKGDPVWLIADEVYYGMSYDEKCASLDRFIDDYPYIIILRGASKSHHMTGWRLGWIYLPTPLIKPYIAMHQFVTTCASAIAQHTFNSIRGTEREIEWLAYQKTLYKSKRDLVKHKLGNLLELKGGEGAFYWLAKLPDHFLQKAASFDNAIFRTLPEMPEKLDELWVWKLLLENGIITVPGSAFGYQSSGYIRISYGPQIEELDRGLSKLAELLT